MAVYNSIIALPWSLKIFFGIISDNVKIFGLRRKPYLIFFGLVQAGSMFALYSIEYDNVITIVVLLFLASLSGAFIAVVYDAILVVQARRDPELGSQDLFSLVFFFQGIGGVTGCIVAAFMMDRYHPKYSFLIYGIMGLLVSIGSIFLSKEAEKDVNPGEEFVSYYSSELLSNQTPSEAQRRRAELEAAKPPRGEEGCCFNFKKNMRLLWWALQRREILFIVLYFILDGLTSPSFGDFSYFFLMNVVGVSKFMFAMIVLIG